MTNDSGTKDFSDESWLTLDEAANAFKVSRRTLERLRGKGNLPGVRAGRFLKIRYIDVQRALTFENPTLALHSLINASPKSLVMDWMGAWSRYFNLLPEQSHLRNPLKQWAEQAGQTHGTLLLGEYQVHHALESARATSLSKVMPVFVTMLERLPANTPFQTIPAELAPLFNPHLGSSS